MQMLIEVGGFCIVIITITLTVNEIITFIEEEIKEKHSDDE